MLSDSNQKIWILTKKLLSLYQETKYKTIKRYETKYL